MTWGIAAAGNETQDRYPSDSEAPLVPMTSIIVKVRETGCDFNDFDEHHVFSFLPA